MDQWGKAGVTCVLWLHWLECFWSCSYRPGWTNQHCEILYQFLQGRVQPLPTDPPTCTQDLLIQFYSAIIPSVLCTSSLSGLSHQTGQEQTAEKTLLPTCPPFRTYSSPESGNGQKTTLQIYHTLNTTHSNSSPLVSATEFCTPKQADTRTVFSHRPSLWRTLISYIVNNPLTPNHPLHSIINYIFTV